ncbi:hypothetical protein BS17DRAFT_548692 [Gyrodon lividus]|nr:hypothetical protein BS17DRAFT_548692 [Gyrodon lividus]
MFTRPAFYHPYKASPPSSSPFHGHQPAGSRLRDCMKLKPCFNLFQGPNFTNARSPAPSPFSSPVRGIRHPEDDPPPTMRLTDLFGADEPKSPKRPRASPPPNLFQAPRLRAKKAAPAQDPLTGPGARKGKYGHRQLTMNSDAIRSFVLPPHRRALRSKEKRDRVRKRLIERHERLEAEAHAEISSLRREAEAVMKDEHMDEGDRIFLTQLKALQLDHVLKHDLERCRERMARAAEEINKRTKEHEERDKEAARLWVEEKDKREEEEEERRLAALRRKEAEEKEAEDAIRRREEERQRAHEEQERKIREEQERLFREELARRIKEEHDRKLKEARERFVREERERIAQEERERQARLLAEQARRAAQVNPPDENIVQQFTTYEAKWDELRNNNSLPPINVSELPWPVLGGISSPEQVTYQTVLSFIFYPYRPFVEGKSARDKVKAEVLRFHPDKFNTRVVPKVQPCQQAVAQEIAGAVTRILTRIMTEEIDKENATCKH